MKGEVYWLSKGGGLYRLQGEEESTGCLGTLEESIGYLAEDESVVVFVCVCVCVCGFFFFFIAEDDSVGCLEWRRLLLV